MYNIVWFDKLYFLKRSLFNLYVYVIIVVIDFNNFFYILKCYNCLIDFKCLFCENLVYVYVIFIGLLVFFYKLGFKNLFFWFFGLVFKFLIYELFNIWVIKGW